MYCSIEEYHWKKLEILKEIEDATGIKYQPQYSDPKGPLRIEPEGLDVVKKDLRSLYIRSLSLHHPIEDMMLRVTTCAPPAIGFSGPNTVDLLVEDELGDMLLVVVTEIPNSQDIECVYSDSLVMELLFPNLEHLHDGTCGVRLDANTQISFEDTSCLNTFNAEMRKINNYNSWIDHFKPLLFYLTHQTSGVLGETNKIDSGLMYALATIRLFPTSKVGYRQAGRLLMLAGKPRLGVRFMEKVQVGKGVIDERTMDGNIIYDADMLQAIAHVCEREFSPLITFDPSKPADKSLPGFNEMSVMIKASVVANDLELRRECLRYLSDAISRVYQASIFLGNVASCNMDKGKYGEAILDCLASIALSAASATCYSVLARSLIGLEMYSTASIVMQRYLDSEIRAGLERLFPPKSPKKKRRKRKKKKSSLDFEEPEGANSSTSSAESLAAVWADGAAFTDPQEAVLEAIGALRVSHHFVGMETFSNHKDASASKRSCANKERLDSDNQSTNCSQTDSSCSSSGPVDSTNCTAKGRQTSTNTKIDNATSKHSDVVGNNQAINRNNKDRKDEGTNSKNNSRSNKKNLKDKIFF
eukprot:Platyproteum_vivax@DN4632_c0_g1_i1.p1